MAEERIILTRAGYEQLSQQLEAMEAMQEEGIEEIAETFDETDYDEGGSLYDAMFDRDRLMLRINNLRHVLARAEVIDEDPDPDRVSPGDEVTVWDVEEQVERRFRIVSGEEVVHGIEGISSESPVGEALLGCQVGDVVEVEVPDGTAHYAIRAVS